MLIDFSFSNFKCFQTPQQFSMLKHNPSEEAEPSQWKNPDILTVAGIFGSNASGKTSLLHALATLSDLVGKSGLRPFSSSPDFSRQAFFSSKTRYEPTDFFIDFIAKDAKHYEYQLSIDDERVLYEDLRVYTGIRTSTIFEREFDPEIKQYSFRYGRPFSGSKKIYEKMSRPDTLFLSTLHMAKNEVVDPAYSELANRIKTFPAWQFEKEINDIITELENEGAHGKALAKVMAQANLGLLSFKINSPISKFMRDIKNPKHPGHDSYKAFIETMIPDAVPDISLEKKTDAIEMVLETDFEDPKELAFIHHSDNEESTLPAEQESRGTLASLAFFSVALRCLSEQSICLIDEFGMSLHPKYVRELIRLFEDPQTNPFQSQLVFTSHDVTLMSSMGDYGNILNRDQIWLAEKNDRTGASNIFPLTAFRVRNNENYMKNYLNGVYGAIPDLDFHYTFFSALNDVISLQSLDSPDGSQ